MCLSPPLSLPLCLCLFRHLLVSVCVGVCMCVRVCQPLSHNNGAYIMYISPSTHTKCCNSIFICYICTQQTIFLLVHSWMDACHIAQPLLCIDTEIKRIVSKQLCIYTCHFHLCILVSSVCICIVRFACSGVCAHRAIVVMHNTQTRPK